jgi:hypothetical protein
MAVENPKDRGKWHLMNTGTGPATDVSIDGRMNAEVMGAGMWDEITGGAAGDFVAHIPDRMFVRTQPPIFVVRWTDAAGEPHAASVNGKAVETGF